MNTGRKVWVSCCLAVCCGLLLLAGPASNAHAAGEATAKKLIEDNCSNCHRFEGKAKSRFELQAPDLMWAGVKFKRPWLIRWLMGKEDNVYQKNYRWDLSRTPMDHVDLNREEAEAMADYFEKHLQDPRVKEGAIDLSKFTKLHAQFGKEMFKEHSCTGCHQIMENGEKMGGPQSVSFFESGKRLNKDWIYRFNSNPPDFVPHSGEFVADVSGLGLYYITGYLATEGDDSFQFYEPWKSEHFKNADAGRGKTIYREYCMQCHGATGEGDGPAASGLEPKPAVHAKMAMDQIPLDYLYNVVYYGGRAVGKSNYMPYWGLTIGEQGVADVIAYMQKTFKGEEETAQAKAGGGPLGECPQDRKTKKAPMNIHGKKNPLPASKSNIQAGEDLYLKKAKPLACAQCHGKQGDGKGPLGAGLKPAPRNFTCGSQMNDIPDGQLFWIIQNGSPGTGMMAFKGLSDNDTWKIVHYLRSLAR